MLRLFVCVCLCELLLGVSPHSGMCAPVRAVARSFSHIQVVCTCMCVPVRAVARSFSTLRYVCACASCC